MQTKKRKNLIPDKWKLKSALCGVVGCRHTYFTVYTHKIGLKKHTEVMVMMTRDEYDALIKGSKFWEGRNLCAPSR